MKRNNLFTKLVAFALCFMMVVGFMPASVFAASATNDWETPIDPVDPSDYPVGSYYNPAVAALDDNVATIEAGSDGYYWIYTADYTGKVTATVSGENGWCYAINDGEEHNSASDPVVDATVIDVTEGDEIMIMVNTYAADAEAPAGEVTLNLAYVPGSCAMYAIFLGEAENVVTNEGTVYYQGYWADQTVTITGEGDFSVISEGETIAAVDGVVTLSYPAVMGRPMPNVIAIVGDGEYTVAAAYAVGHMNNPAVAVLGDNSGSVAAGSQGYYWNYTADYTGKLSITLPEGNWTYGVNNKTAGTYGDTQWSDSDPVVNPAIVDVTEGDVLEIIVNTYDPANEWNAPAGDVSFELAYVPGSCAAFAIFLGETENVVTNEGTVYYQGYWADQTVTITGEGDFSVISEGETIAAVDGVVTLSYPAVMGRPMPNVIAIVGDGEFTVAAAYAVGHVNNPAVAVLGNNSGSVAAGSQGYYWNYTAPEAGDLIITLPAGNWTYTINNKTSYVYGDTQWSDSDPVVNPATVTVAAGDVLEIIVNTYDPANEWNAPAGDVSFTMDYKKEVVLPSGNAELKFAAASITLESDLSVTFKVKKEVYDAFENVRVEFKLGQDGTVNVAELDSVDASGRSCYVFSGIAAKQVNDWLYATVYGTYEGQEYSYTSEYNIAAKYCTNMLGKATTGAELKTLLVDLINYGTAAQRYFHYNEENLAINNLTDEQKALGTSAVPTMEAFANGKYEVVSNPKAQFTGVSLVLESKVVTRCKAKFLTEDIDLSKVTLEIRTLSGDSWSIPYSEWTETSGGYSADFSGLAARQMRERLLINICEDGVPVSNTLLQGVEHYCAKNSNDGNELQEITIALMRYVDAANAFFN